MDMWDTTVLTSGQIIKNKIDMFIVYFLTVVEAGTQEVYYSKSINH